MAGWTLAGAFWLLLGEDELFLLGDSEPVLLAGVLDDQFVAASHKLKTGDGPP